MPHRFLADVTVPHSRNLPMNVYIINLDSAKERWSYVVNSFAGTPFTICRVSAVDGYALQLPIPEYSETRYRWFHGRPTAPGHVGCYLSHIKAMTAFLATEDDYALIAEDDLSLSADFEDVLSAAMLYSRQWNILRLTGLGKGRPARVATLLGDTSLCIGFARLKGTGAYVIDRLAARVLSTGLLPMRLPIDHAMDREWFFGLRAAYVLPFPASQLDAGFRSSIQRGQSLKLSFLRRCLATYPYQAANELSRWVFRLFHYFTFKWFNRDARLSSIPLVRPGGVGS